jgi:hypothetical protein
MMQQQPGQQQQQMIPQQQQAYGQQMPSAYPQAQPQAQPQLHQAYGAPAAYAQQTQQMAAPQAAAPKPVSVWSEHKTDDGNVYWYNSSTGVSQVG